MFPRARKWSPVEIEYLRRNFRGDTPLSQLSIELDRTPTAIKNYAAKLGLGSEQPSVVEKKPPGAKSKAGKRTDLGISVRSPWEANVLRVLNYLGEPWKYEPKTFYFIGEKRGATTYTPDIYLPRLDVWLEIKGHLNSQGRSKIRKFKKYFPKEFSRLRVIPGTNRNSAAKWFALFGIPAYAFYNVLRFDHALTIPHWEHDEVSAKWIASKRQRKRPDDIPLVVQPPTPKARVRQKRLRED